MPADLERLYQDAKSALKDKDLDRASDLLRQILLVDDNYKDASRLLAQVVRLKRRRWYNDPRFWVMLAMLLLIGLGVFLAPKLRTLYAGQAVPIPSRQAATLPPTLAATSTAVTLSSPTPIPLVWKRISLGTEFSRDLVTGFEIDPNDADVLYVLMEHAGYFKSIDGGVSWQPTRWGDAPADIQSGLNVYEEQKLVDPNGATTIMATNLGPDGQKRAYRVGWLSNGGFPTYWSVSEDDGLTWKKLAYIGKPESWAIAFDTQGSFYVSCSGYMCKYNPSGSKQIRLGLPDVGAFTLITISSVNQNVIYAAGTGLAVSKDGGETWAGLNNGLGSAVLQLDTALGSTPTLYVQSGQCSDDQLNDDAGMPLYLSEDGGKSWSLSLRTGCYLIQDADKTTIYRVGRQVLGGSHAQQGWIWRSADAGKSWEQQFAPGSAQALIADPVQAGFLYATMILGYERWASIGLLEDTFTSQDHGHSWETHRGGAWPQPCSGSTPRFMDTNPPMATDPRDGNHVLYIVDGVIFESVNGCSNQRLLVSHAPEGLSNSIAFDSNHPSTLYAGTDHGAYISTDDGQSWGQINDGLLGVDVVYSIAIDKDGTVYAATPYGIFTLEAK